MKKLISIALALALMMSFAVSVSAEENVGTGEYAANVTGSYVADTTEGTVFSVNITWTGMNFTYYAKQKDVWNVKDHVYTKGEDAHWTGEGTITVTNHSNAKITAVPKFNAADGYDEVEMKFGTDKLRLDSAETNQKETVGTITVTPGGEMPAVEGKVTIGTITVTIAQDNDVTVEEAEALVAKANTLIEEAKAAGKYDTYAAQFTSMIQDKNTVQDLIDLYRAVENGSVQWSDAFTFEEWKEEINSSYRYLLSGYNNCLNVTGL